jgi:predicted transcriptional regulator
MTEKAARQIDSALLLELTTRIVSSYASKANLTATELTDTIASVSRALGDIGGGTPAPEKKELVPAVPVKKSVTPDFIICLEDGKKLKMLKRHLMSTYNMTPEQYKAKWDLPKDYPLVAPNYARTRSELAKKIGLGKPASAPKRAGRKKVAVAAPAAE